MQDDSNTKVCKVDGCDLKAVARGMCNKHYKRWTRLGTTTIVKPTEKCIICGEKTFATFYCGAHYQRIRRYGDPGALKKTPSRLLTGFIEEVVRNPLPDRCVIWPYGKSNGYGELMYKGKRWRAHRLSLFLYTGEIPEGMDALHGPCHDRACINPHLDHGLRWGTHQQNMDDKLRDGIYCHGEDNPMSKLTERQAVAIFLDRRSAESISNEFNVSKAAVWDIKRGNNWGWLTSQLT